MAGTVSGGFIAPDRSPLVGYLKFVPAPVTGTMGRPAGAVALPLNGAGWVSGELAEGVYTVYAYLTTTQGRGVEFTPWQVTIVDGVTNTIRG